MAYRCGQNYECSIHNIKGYIKTSKSPNYLLNAHKIYQTVKSYIKIATKIPKSNRLLINRRTEYEPNIYHKKFRYKNIK